MRPDYSKTIEATQINVKRKVGFKPENLLNKLNFFEMGFIFRAVFEQKIAMNERILKDQMKHLNDKVNEPLKKKLEQNRNRNMLQEEDERRNWSAWTHINRDFLTSEKVILLVFKKL